MENRTEDEVAAEAVLSKWVPILFCNYFATLNLYCTFSDHLFDNNQQKLSHSLTMLYCRKMNATHGAQLKTWKCKLMRAGIHAHMP